MQHAAGERPPIIDVHMHAMATSPDAVIAELDAHNVVAVVLSSLMRPRTQEWAARDARFIPSLAFRDASIPLDKVRELVQRHTVTALGELGFAYAGLRPDDPRVIGVPSDKIPVHSSFERPRHDRAPSETR